MPTQWPTGTITYPFSGILSGYVVHPYHISTLYDEVSGVESSLLTGFWNFSKTIVQAPLVFTNAGNNSTLSGNFASASQSGFLKRVDWNTFNSGLQTSGGNISGNLTINGTLTLSGNTNPGTSGFFNIGQSGIPFSGIWSNQYGTTLFPQAPGGAATAATINWNQGSSQSLNFNPGFSGAVTLTLKNGLAGSNYTLTTTQNPSGTTSLLWPGTVKWPNFLTGVPTASGNAIDVFNLYGYADDLYLASVTSNLR